MDATHHLDLTEELVEAFASATADRSSLHMDVAFARQTRFRQTVVHGMLPVACLLLKAMPAGMRIRALSCRFVAPARIGDHLEMSLVQAGDHYAIDIRHRGAPVTTGKLGLIAADAAPTPGSPRDKLFDAEPTENCLTVADLSPGHAEQLDFHAAPSALRTIIDRAWDAFDPTLIAILPVSTMIGMRLPGRYATFDEFSAVFTRSVPADAAIRLDASVKTISAAANRARLTLHWSEGGIACGEGTASVVINRAAPAGQSYAELAGAAGFGLAGRVALVTGASRGIGEATAKMLAIHGARVAVHYFRGGDDAQAIVDDIRANGGDAVAVAADLRDKAAIAAMFETVQTELGPVDILVNNAVGEFQPKAVEALEAEDYLDELTVSLFGMHACCKLALPHMRAQRWGKVINLGTIATEIPPGGQNKYVTVKSALVGYTRSLAAELAGDNIQVNLVMPRMTETSLIASLPPALVDKLAEESPGGKLLQPAEIARAIVFLASDWAASISGQRLVLNNGEAPFL